MHFNSEIYAFEIFLPKYFNMKYLKELYTLPNSVGSSSYEYKSHCFKKNLSM